MGITARVALSASAAAARVPGMPQVRPLSAPDLVHANNVNNRPATCKLQSAYKAGRCKFNYEHLQPIYIYSTVLSTRKQE